MTDYTAMVVVRDEVFDAHGIKRSNKERLAIEEAARQQRAQRPAVSTLTGLPVPNYPAAVGLALPLKIRGQGLPGNVFAQILFLYCLIQFKTAAVGGEI